MDSEPYDLVCVQMSVCWMPRKRIALLAPHRFNYQIYF